MASLTCLPPDHKFASKFRDLGPPMLSSFRAMKFALSVQATAAMLACAPTLSHAATGSVRIIITRVEFVVGGGSGTLHLQGKRYPLRVSGVSAGPFGAARVDLVGRAYNMRTTGSIHGVYSTVSADGAGLVRLRNWHGVVLELHGRQGVQPSVDLNGMAISLR
jgi:hypothetical protein